MLNFPSNPSLNQEYTYNNKKWIYNGTSWVSANLLSAKNVLVTDTGDFYADTDVESVLQEVGTQIIGLISDKTYIHEQMVSSASWVITHNMNKFPSVQIVNNFNEVVIGSITFNTLNQITIDFAGAFSGMAYLN